MGGEGWAGGTVDGEGHDDDGANEVVDGVCDKQVRSKSNVADTSSRVSRVVVVAVGWRKSTTSL